MNIHIAKGAMVCGHIRELGVDPNRILMLSENLSFGPVISTLGSTWMESRREFLNGFLGRIFDTSDLPVDYQTLSASLSKLNDADQIIFWAGPSLDEQLIFVWTVAVLMHLKVERSKLRYLLVTHDSHYCSPISSLNSLSQDGFIRAHHAGGLPLDEQDFEILGHAWQALCASEPRQIMRYRKQFPPRLSLVLDRICRLERRYPFLKTGLNAFDSRVLQICARCGPRAVSIAAEYVCNDHDDFDYPNDSVFHGRLLKLASADLKFPLLELEGDITRFSSFTVKLTEVGKAVLVGEANHVELNGIDEWIGGVHLQSSSGLVWFYDPEQTKLVQVGIN